MNLEPLRDALAKATATPWKITDVSGHAGDLYAATAQRIPDCHHIARFYAPKPEKAPSCSLAAMGAAREAISQIEANATLTALAVNALPDLLAEITRQREVIEAWHDIDRKRDAEIERLREAPADVSELRWAADMLSRESIQCALGIEEISGARCAHCSDTNMRCFQIGRVREALKPFCVAQDETLVAKGAQP